MTEEEKNSVFIKRREEYNRKRAEIKGEIDRINELHKIIKESENKAYADAYKSLQNELHELRLQESAARKALAEQLYAETENTPEKVCRRVGFEIQRAAQHVIDKYAEKYPIDKEGVQNNFEWSADAGVKFNIIIPLKIN